MTPAHLRRPGLALAGLLAAAALAGLARAQGQPQFQPPPGPGQPPVQFAGGGTDLFRALLDRKGVEPVRRADLAALRADDDLIVVVLGPAQVGGQTDGLYWAREAIAAGGAALVAGDGQAALHAHDLDPQVDRATAEFSGDAVQLPRNRADQGHRGLPDCPYAVPVSPDDVLPLGRPRGPVWGVFRGLDKVATNKPTNLVMHGFRAEYQYPLARLPRGTLAGGVALNPPPLLAVGGDGPPGGDGRGYAFLAVADPSVFINQMMEEGTDNFALAQRTADYLCGPGAGRKRCLFLENGQVKERFDGMRNALAPPRPPIPPEAVPNVGPLFGKHQDKLIGFLDAKADEIQQRDVLHRSLVGPPGSDQERRRVGGWLGGLAVLLAIIAGRLFLVWFFRVRSPTDLPPAPVTGAGAASAGPPGVFERRQKELVRRNNVYEPVRARAREFFAAAGAPPDAGPRMPPLEVSDAVKKPDSLRQAVRDLWRLAYGPPAALTAQRWYELEPYFERLRQAHADGKWRFVLR